MSASRQSSFSSSFCLLRYHGSYQIASDLLFFGTVPVDTWLDCAVFWTGPDRNGFAGWLDQMVVVMVDNNFSF